jgi:hypothetical protein
LFGLANVEGCDMEVVSGATPFLLLIFLPFLNDKSSVPVHHLAVLLLTHQTQSLGR